MKSYKSSYIKYIMLRYSYNWREPMNFEIEPSTWKIVACHKVTDDFGPKTTVFKFPSCWPQPWHIQSSTSGVLFCEDADKQLKQLSQRTAWELEHTSRAAEEFELAFAAWRLVGGLHIPSSGELEGRIMGSTQNLAGLGSQQRPGYWGGGNTLARMEMTLKWHCSPSSFWDF